MTSQLSEPDESLVSRVRKLLDKAEGTENTHESEAFSAKAAELIARHRIDPARLAERGGVGDDLIVHEMPIGRGAYVRGRLALLDGVANSHDVRMVFISTPTGTVAMLAGRREDIDLTLVMYTSLHSQVSSQMAGLRKATGAATQRERRAFLFGFAYRMADLLWESNQAAAKRSEKSADGGAAMALVVRERQQQVTEFAEQRFGKVRSASKPAGVDTDGFDRGTAAAERADVGRTRLGGRTAIGKGKG